MNRKIIKSICVRKHQALCESIEDPRVKELVQKNTIITGGAIPSMLAGEKVNDFDLYFTDLETVKAVAEYYVHKFIVTKPLTDNDKTKTPRVVVDGDRVRIRVQSAGAVSETTDTGQYQYFERELGSGDEYVKQMMESLVTDGDDVDGTKLEGAADAKDKEGEKKKFRPIFLTDNSITLSDKIQLVIRFYGSPEEIHKNYDFVHCTNYWTSSENRLVLHVGALESLITKQLFYIGSKYPLCSFVRMRKFIKKGWHINAGQILKMSYQLSELDLNNIEVLEDQLTGVDTAYFVEMINHMKKEQAENPDFQLSMPYLVSLIDRIF